MKIFNKKVVSLIILILLIAIPASASGYKLVSKKVLNLTLDNAPKKPFNILILGSDSRTESYTGRADAIMIVHVDPQENSSTLVSFPRDSRVPIPGRGSNKINAAMSYGGPELAVKAVENYSKLKIDFYAVATFKSFVRIINSFNGVQVFVDQPINDRFAGPPVPGGNQRLDGLRALAYARSRKKVKGGDFGRAAHQQNIMISLCKQESQLSPAEFLKMIPTLITNIKTNVSYKDLFKMGLLLPKIESNKVKSYVLKGGTGSVGGSSSVILNHAEAQEIFSKLR